ncbi:MAG: hypothetical protein ABFS86_10810 [Planctomycetota bacterium]
MADVTRTAKWAGRLLILGGVVGVLTGFVPLVENVSRLLGLSFSRLLDEWSAHGVDALGLTVPWATLSSADGTFLGALLILAGVGWIRGKPWAPLITLLYAIHGMTITGLDLIIFSTQAEPGEMRSRMLLLDGIAFAAAATTFVLLAVWWLRRPHFAPAPSPR